MWVTLLSMKKMAKFFYEVYVYNQNEGEEPAKQNIDNYKYGHKTEYTNYEIILESPSIYFLGVRVYLF